MAGLDVEAVKTELDAIAGTLQKHLKCAVLLETALKVATDLLTKARFSWREDAEDAFKKVKGSSLLLTATVRSMKAHVLAQNVQIAALRTLLAIAEVIEHGRSEFDDEGGASAVLSAMVLHPTSIEIQELSCTLIVEWPCLEAAGQAFWDAGGLLAVLSSLRGSLGTQSLLLKACEVLELFALELTDCEKKMVRANAAEAVMACMEANPDHEDLHWVGARVLKYVAEGVDKESRQMLLDNGCFKAIFAYIAKFQSCWHARGLVDEVILPWLERFVRYEQQQQDQVLQMMKDGALDVILPLACLERGSEYKKPMLGVLRAVVELSSTNEELKALVRDAGVFDKLVQSLKADKSHGVCRDFGSILCELAESCDDLLGDIELARELVRSDWYYFFRVSLLSGRSCAVMLRSYDKEDTLIATAARKLQLGNAPGEGAALLLEDEPLRGGCPIHWGLDCGEIYDVQLVFTKRRRLTDAE